MKRLIAVLALVGALTACGTSEQQAQVAGADVDRLRVVASFYPMAELASRVGEGVVSVENLTPAGMEPHDLELSPSQVDDVQSADLVVYVGHGFAPAVEQAVKNGDGRSLDVTEGMQLPDTAEQGNHGDAGAEEDAHAEDEHGDGKDPHFWLDPRLMIAASEKVEARLVALAPDRATQIRANGSRYRSELQVLDGEMQSGLTTCRSRTIVTSHAAFEFLATRYGLEQHAVSISPDAEPDPKAMDELVHLIENEQVTTVFSETLVSSRVADALAREANVKTAVLNPLEGLTQEQQRNGSSYLSVMRENLQALRAALDCS